MQSLLSTIIAFLLVMNNKPMESNALYGAKLIPGANCSQFFVRKSFKIMAFLLAVTSEPTGPDVLNGARQILHSPDGSQILVLKSLKPPTAFSSIPQELRLYDRNYKLLDKCRFGEYPVSVEGWDKMNIYITIDMSYRENDLDTIDLGIKGCPQLGGYCIKYYLITSDRDAKY